MPRHLIHLIGALVTLAVVALAVFLVAVPIALEALGVFGQTATVANTNASYQAQVDSLREESERIDEIQGSVAALESQITPANDLDDVFELVAHSAETSGVTITSVTAGDPVPFIERTSATALDAAAAEAVPAPAATDTPAADAAQSDASASEEPAAEASTAPAGRQQVDFTVNVTAAEFDQVVRFLDGLRAGPRLLGQIESTVTPTGTGFDVTLTALTFLLPEEG